jgi:3-dehydroquinate synthetase
VKVLEIHGRTGNSTILIGESLQYLQDHINSEEVVIITDKNVRLFFSKDFLHYEVIEIGTGEKIKNLDTVEAVYGKLVELEADRSSFIVGVEALLKKLKLPTRLELDGERVLDALRKDKKRNGDSIDFVLLSHISHAVEGYQ